VSALEARVADLEDTVAALSSIVGTMTEMLHRLNGIASHYVDTVAALAPPGPAPCADPDPDDDGRC